METAEPYRHPVDYQVCPRAGLVFLIWGASLLVGDAYEWDGTLGPAEVGSLLLGLGILLFGAAIRLPEGTARSWLLRAWLTTILAFGAMFLVSFLIHP
jgi:hypothetical protein